MNRTLSRRELLTRGASGIGIAALSSLLSEHAGAADATMPLPHFAPKAKRVIYLFQFGGPSQIDLFDPKPQLAKLQASDLPASIRMGQRLTAMTAGQSTFPVASSLFKFAQHGSSGAWISELLPHTAKVADRLCFIK